MIVILMLPRIASYVLLCLVCVSSPVVVVEQDVIGSASLVILVIADTHNGGLHYTPNVDNWGRTQGERCRDLIKSLDHWQFDCMVVLGDFVDDAWNHTHLEMFRRDFYDPYHERYDQPLFLVQGNHEVETGDAYSWYHPNGWYAVDMKGIHLLFCGWGGHWTAPSFSDQNMTWIHKDLVTTDLSTIMFFHAPMITDAYALSGNQNPLNVTQARILCSYPNIIGFATGHTHGRGLGLVSDYFDFEGSRPIFTYNPYAICTGHIRCQSNMDIMELGVISVYKDHVVVEGWDADRRVVMWQGVFYIDTTLSE